MCNYSRKVIIVISLLLISTLFSQAAVIRENTLVNGTGIYLKTEESWNFQQGYILEIKDVNPAEKSLWLELLLDNESLKDTVLHEGEIFTYSTDSREIFNITVDKIYSGPEGELVTFKPVYQYLDPQLPEPVAIETNADEEKNQDPDVTQNNENKNIPGFGTGIAILGMLATYLLYKKR